MKFKIHFTDQHKIFAEVRVFDNQSELKKFWRDKKSWSHEIKAFVIYHYGAKNNTPAKIFFARECLSMGTIAHECSHAALNFIHDKVMPSETVSKMTLEEQGEYYDEAMATVVGNLFDQIEENIFAPLMNKIPKNVKCDCGHYAKDHYQGVGWCHDSGHKNPGQCGCTWYHPNTKWVNRQKQLAAKENEN